MTQSSRVKTRFLDSSFSRFSNSDLRFVQQLLPISFLKIDAGFVIKFVNLVLEYQPNLYEVLSKRISNLEFRFIRK